MTISETIALVASILAVITSVFGLIYQILTFRQKDKELKHRMDMDRKEFDEKYATRKELVERWVKKLPNLPDAVIGDKDNGYQLPYQYVGPIRNPKLFFGCHEHIEAVENYFSATQIPSISIVGVRKSGKTSFLLHIQRLFNAKQYPQLIPVYIDAQNPITSDKRFYAYLLREASATLETRIKTGAPMSEVPVEVEFEELNLFLEQAGKKHYKFVFLLDEFERLAHDPKIASEDFFSSLRSLIVKGNVSWVIASVRKIHTPDTVTSPFHNIFQDAIWLGPLRLRDARALVATPAASTIHPFEDEDIDLIIHLAGRMPCLLQKAALMLYKLHRAGFSGAAARIRLADEFIQEAPSEFEDQLSLLTYEEKEALFQLALHRNVSCSARLLRQIEQYGFIEKGTNGYQILGSALNEYLTQKAEAIGLG